MGGDVGLKIPKKPMSKRVKQVSISPKMKAVTLHGTHKTNKQETTKKQDKDSPESEKEKE